MKKKSVCVQSSSALVVALVVVLFPGYLNPLELMTTVVIVSVALNIKQLMQKNLL